MTNEIASVSRKAGSLAMTVIARADIHRLVAILSRLHQDVIRSS
jgi:hypothetical protein